MNYISATAGEEWYLRATQLLGADRWREQKGLAFVIFIFIRPVSYHVCIDLSLTHWLYGWLMFWNLIDAGLAVEYVNKKLVDLVADGYVGVM